ncbi:MAG TPA: rod shape-determining protein [Blastocatellia bacterium]|nr:rod shape-determining protein [Blastocatellia bacterium]
MHTPRAEGATTPRQLPRLSRLMARAKESLRRTFSNDMAVDLGTSNTIIYVPDEGVVLNEPSVIAFNRDTRQVIAVGREAKVALGRQASSISVVRPLKDGVIADFDAAELMLSYFIKAALSRHRLTNPRVLICAPCEVSQIERRALEDAAGRAGAKYVDIVEEPIAAAIGAGFDIQSGRIFMLVDIGGGTTGIAVLGFGGPVHMATLRVGGAKMDEAIALHIRHAHCLEIGELTAETVKIEMGRADRVEDEGSYEVRGRDVRTGLPSVISITGGEVRAALEPVIEQIVKGIQAALEELPAEVSAGLLESGIVVTGGGSKLAGLVARIAGETGLDVRQVNSDAQSIAVLGAGKLFRDGDYTSIRELMLKRKAARLFANRDRHSVDQAA